MKKTRKRLQLQIETVGLFEVVGDPRNVIGGLKPSIDVCPPLSERWR